MLTHINEGKGLVKVYWEDVRKQISSIDKQLLEIIDEINPDKTFPLFLAYYPYGDLIGDTETIFLPTLNGKYYPLNDKKVPKEVLKHLGYGRNDSPLGMVLEKKFEIFIELKDEGIVIPWSIRQPGDFVSFIRNLNKKTFRTYMPNSVLSAASGTRSAFILPHIGCVTNHSNLQRDFNIHRPPAKSLYEHWYLFRDIVNSNFIDCNWRSCLMYFSEKWVQKLNNDKAWFKLKVYLHEYAWKQSEYERNRVYYDIAFSVIQNKRNLKPNPYLADTARHLFAIALGFAPGFSPTSNNESLPLNILERVFLDSYGLKKYFPTIMQPVHFNFEKDQYPVYYSLQNPSTYVFSPKSRKISSTLFEMRELEHIMRIFLEEFATDYTMCSDTVMGQVAKFVNFIYFHNETDRHRIIKPSHEIPKHDKRFKSNSQKDTELAFARDAKFVRGCISINGKN